jgi:Domain of unknown function (DUF4402)
MQCGPGAALGQDAALPNIQDKIAESNKMPKLRSTFRNLIACCLLCLGAPGALTAQDSSDVPLQISIRTQLDFSRAATGGATGGQIRIDPVNGSRQLDGDIVDLGGSALAGSAVITGAPGRNVRIDLPLSIRMSGSNGGAVTISNLRTNLTPNPRLDAFGKLEFSFGGDLEINGSVAGTFRGRIPITAEYE